MCPAIALSDIRLAFLEWSNYFKSRWHSQSSSNLQSRHLILTFQMNICHYDVQRNEKFGRYLTAKKDLNGGELIFTDLPMAIGPKPDTAPLCLGCYCPIENSLCSKCCWPICSSECEQSFYHQPECEVFSKVKVKFQRVEDWTAIALQLDCITPLRLLLAKERDPERWTSEVDMMETHTEERKRRPAWQADQVNIVNYLLSHCKLGDRFSKELVEQACGVLEVNAVEIPSRGGFSIRAIYPRLAVAAHSCVPNIVHIILQPDYRVEIRAAVPIKTGEPLYLSYTHVLSPTIVRREHLRESKFFYCECPRCADATELGTHLSTLKCNKCNSGLVLSSNPLDNDAPWICSEKQCSCKTSSSSIRKLLHMYQEEMEQLDLLEPGSSSLHLRETILNKYKSVVHPRHSVMLCVSLALCQLYGRGVNDLTQEVLERKVECCRHVMHTLDVITPGDTRMRGMMLYELHAPLTHLARRDFGAGIISQEILKQRLQEPLQCLSDAARILCREDPHSPEGITGKIALQSVEQLKATLEDL